MRALRAAMTSTKNSLWDYSLFAYKAPKYLVEAAKKKYGKNITVVGATKKSLDDFWGEVGYRVDTGQMISKPVEKGKTIVSIDTKTHSNTTKKALEDGTYGPKKGDDWYDDFVITSKKSSDEKRAKTYNLHLDKTTSWSIGGDCSIASSGFFNLAGPGVTPNVSANAKYTKTKTQSEKQSKHSEETLSQGYEIVDTFKVPPNTTVKAKITTYAVTHESKTVTRLIVDPKAFIRVRYLSYFSKTFLGGFWKSEGIITAEDLFTDEEDYEEVEEYITFTSESKVSYLGEEVEVHKTMFDCN